MSALVCFAVFLAGVAVCLHMGWALIWAMLLGIAGVRRARPAARVFSADALGLCVGAGAQDVLAARDLCTDRHDYRPLAQRGNHRVVHLPRPADHHAAAVHSGDVRADVLSVVCAGDVLRRGRYGGDHPHGARALGRGEHGRDGRGDRRRGVFRRPLGSPASSSASLVAAATGTKLEENLRAMHRTLAAAAAERGGIRRALPRRHPIAAVDGAMLGELAQAFDLSLWTVLPRC